MWSSEGKPPPHAGPPEVLDASTKESADPRLDASAKSGPRRLESATESSVDGKETLDVVRAPAFAPDAERGIGESLFYWFGRGMGARPFIALLAARRRRVQIGGRARARGSRRDFSVRGGTLRGNERVCGMSTHGRGFPPRPRRPRDSAAAARCYSGTRRENARHRTTSQRRPNAPWCHRRGSRGPAAGCHVDITTAGRRHERSRSGDWLCRDNRTVPRSRRSSSR